MPTTLTAYIGDLVAVKPTVDANNQLMGLDVIVRIEWKDQNNVAKTATNETVDLWSLLTEQQKTNQQEIQNVIMGHLLQMYPLPNKASLNSSETNDEFSSLGEIV